LAALVIVAAASACSSSSKSVSPPATTTVSTTATTTPTAATTTPPGTNLSSPSPEQAAKTYFATRVADIVGFRFSNCQGAAGSIYCTFVRRGTRVVIQVDDTSVPHKIVGVKRAALDAPATAAEFLSAWQAGSGEAVAALSRPAATAAATTLESRAQLPWQLDKCEGAAGSIFCTYKAGGSQLVIRVEQVNPPPVVAEVRFAP
jgi:hypothetical protein